MSNKYYCFAVVKLYSNRCVAGFKSRFDIFFLITLYLQDFTVHCSNVDEWLHIDVCTHCQNCVRSLPS